MSVGVASFAFSIQYAYQHWGNDWRLAGQANSLSEGVVWPYHLGRWLTDSDEAELTSVDSDSSASLMAESLANAVQGSRRLQEGHSRQESRFLFENALSLATQVKSDYLATLHPEARSRFRDHYVVGLETFLQATSELDVDKADVLLGKWFRWALEVELDRSMLEQPRQATVQATR